MHENRQKNKKEPALSRKWQESSWGTGGRWQGRIRARSQRSLNVMEGDHCTLKDFKVRHMIRSEFVDTPSSS